MMDWTFLDKFNTTAGKGWSVMWLWIYTGAVWGLVAIICAFRKSDPPSEWLIAWATPLVAYSGVSAYQFGTQRNTDYGALQIKAGATPATTNVTNVQTEKANVTTGGTTP